MRLFTLYPFIIKARRKGIHRNYSSVVICPCSIGCTLVVVTNSMVIVLRQEAVVTWHCAQQQWTIQMRMLSLLTTHLRQYKNILPSFRESAIHLALQCSRLLSLQLTCVICTIHIGPLAKGASNSRRR